MLGTLLVVGSVSFSLVLGLVLAKACLAAALSTLSPGAPYQGDR